MIPAVRCFTAADLCAARIPSRTRKRPPVPYIQPPPPAHPQAHVSAPPTQRSAVHHFTPSRRQRQPPHRRLLFLPKTAPFSSSVAFLTPPTFPAPAPRKRFFSPLPTKILGFRTRKGRLPRRQYLARARLEFRAGQRVVVSSRARAFGISCGLLAGGAGGWLAALAVDGLRCAAPVRLRGMVSPARACAFGISCACPAGGAGGWLTALPTAGTGRRPADRLPAVLQEVLVGVDAEVFG